MTVLAYGERYAHLSPVHKAQAVERIAMQVFSEPENSILAWQQTAPVPR